MPVRIRSTRAPLQSFSLLIRYDEGLLEVEGCDRKVAEKHRFSCNYQLTAGEVGTTAAGTLKPVFSQLPPPSQVYHCPGLHLPFFAFRVLHLTGFLLQPRSVFLCPLSLTCPRFALSSYLYSFGPGFPCQQHSSALPALVLGRRSGLWYLTRMESTARQSSEGRR